MHAYIHTHKYVKHFLLSITFLLSLLTSAWFFMSLCWTLLLVICVCMYMCYSNCTVFQKLPDVLKSSSTIFLKPISSTQFPQTKQTLWNDTRSTVSLAARRSTFTAEIVIKGFTKAAGTRCNPLSYGDCCLKNISEQTENISSLPFFAKLEAGRTSGVIVEVVETISILQQLCIFIKDYASPLKLGSSFAFLQHQVEEMAC